jgi:hypothetical protein
MKEIDLAFVGEVLLGIVLFVAFVFASPYLLRGWHQLMSRVEERQQRPETTSVLVHVPVQPDQYEARTTPPLADDVIPKAKPDSPDTDAADSGTDWQPKLPRYPTERELVIYLTTIRDRSGKHLRSANEIAKFSKLHRNEVLKLVKEVREGPAQYPPRTPEQQASRAVLNLDR